ncbi:hypothetical protein RJT34_17133 [Clitoria ternatea]|uniref:Uncharacterized protein n=1 Tax=Clitoria ternatea TaxID=43366 RepID=A0AAN9PDH4_CLITE
MLLLCILLYLAVVAAVLCILCCCFSYEFSTWLAVLHKNKYQVWRRPSIGQSGPLGGDFPLVTREGHNVLDVIFTSPIQSLAEVAKSLDKVDGVVDHGVISKIPCTVVIASQTGLNVLDKLTADIELALAVNSRMFALTKFSLPLSSLFCESSVRLICSSLSSFNRYGVVFFVSYMVV